MSWAANQFRSFVAGSSGDALTAHFIAATGGEQAASAERCCFAHPPLPALIMYNFGLSKPDVLRLLSEANGGNPCVGPPLLLAEARVQGFTLCGVACDALIRLYCDP